MKKMIFGFLLTLFSLSGIAATNGVQKMTVALDGKLNPDHAPLIVAQQQGLFKEQGLEVSFVNPGKKADVSVTYQPDFIHQVDEGKSLVHVGTLIDKPLNCIATLKSSGINTLADLKGKRIGTSKSELNNIMLKTMLKNAGLSEQDVKIVPVRRNLSQALLSHKVDAVAGLTRNAEVPQLEAQGHELNVFLPEENGVPNYSVLIFVTSKANANDARLPRFLAALKEAVDYLDEHPEQAWRSFAKTYPQANNKQNHAAWLATLPYFAEDPAAFDGDEWKRFAEFMHNNESIKMAKPASHDEVTVG